MTSIGIGVGISFAESQKVSQYILDEISGSVAAYSLRKLKNTAVNCIRVRRSSDSTELDIGFSGSSLDTASLLAFVGAGSGYVAKWYDQSENTNDGIQPAASYQPLIVSFGTLIAINGNPAMQFDGADSNLIVANTSVLALTNTLTFDAWIQMLSYGETSIGRILDKGAANYAWYPDNGSSLATLNLNLNNTNYRGNTGAFSDITQAQHLLSSFDKNLASNQIKHFRNNIAIGTNTKTTSITTDTSDLCIGNRAARDRAFHGKIAEIIIRNTDVNAQVSTIFNNGKDYYGV